MRIMKFHPESGCWNVRNISLHHSVFERTTENGGFPIGLREWRVWSLRFSLSFSQSSAQLNCYEMYCTCSVQYTSITVCTYEQYDYRTKTRMHVSNQKYVTSLEGPCLARNPMLEGLSILYQSSFLQSTHPMKCYTTCTSQQYSIDIFLA